MTAIVQLDDYLHRVEQRLRFLAASRGAAITALAALLLTVLLVWIGNEYRFADDVVWPLRLLLFASLAAAIAFTLAIPIRKLNRRFVTKLAEEKEPSFGERLLTVAERRNEQNPFLELIAEDAMGVAQQHGPEQFAQPQFLYSAMGISVLALCILIWLISAGPGFWGYGASLLWTGKASANKRPLYELTVQPGNKTIRRRSDQMITAHLQGFSAHQVTLHARYGEATKWDSVVMQPATDGNAYQFRFVGLSDPVEYYVAADGSESKHFKIAVRDLPGVKRVKLALHYPAELHLKDQVQDPGGDIRAVENTVADVSVLTDRPLDHGVLVMEDGSRVELAKADGNWLTAKLTVHKDGSYHVAALDSGEAVRISDDYFIEAGKDEPPSVRILTPSGDPKVSPIEEMPVKVEATDDFGVEALELHYSVNGGAEQVVPLLQSKGAKEASGSKLITLEDFKLVPGDLISMYAVAKDATHTTRSEIMFAQAEPFDFKFSQSQQMGGGGGGGDMDQQSDISVRQKQIIAATWNQEREPGKNKTALQENAKFLSDTEGKLAEQAKTLAERMASREMGGAGSSFANFSKLMTQASDQMKEAVGQLKPGKWHDALPVEQKALQSLMRAEALFRDIQIAFGQQGGGGGGGGAQRDLARMFDLELDTTKNQYETGQQSQQQKQSDQQKAVDEALEKLKELAKRQEQLAQQQKQQQAFEQRWQEEQLRREAEELRRQMQEMAQQQQQQSGQQQSGQQQQSASSSGSSSGQSSSSARQQQQQQAQQQQQQQRQMADGLKRSMEALQRSEEEMRKAVSNQDPAAQRRAAENLQQAENALNKAMQQQADGSVGGLSQRAQEMAREQRQIANSLKNMYGEQSGSQMQRMMRRGQPEPDPNSLPELRDPQVPVYYGYDRRRWDGDMPMPHNLNEQEKAIADEKAKLAKQIQDLQRDMQQQERSLANSQPGASSKMRKALSDAEQNELAMRMQKTAEWMKDGFGNRNLNSELKMADGLEQLSKDLQDVQKAVQEGDGNKPGAKDRSAEALAEVRNLRQMLERAQQQKQDYQMQNLARGDQNGQQQQGSQQQGGQQQGGRQQGGQQQGGQRGGNQYSPNGGANWDMNGSDLQGAIDDLNAWRGRIDPRDRDLRTYLDNTLGDLRLLHADPNRLQSTVGQDAVTRLERLEVELARRAGELQEKQGARSRAPEDSPEKYRDAVAEYFRKLSQTKR